MVKHAHNKKRRAGWYGKVKRKQRTWNRYNPNPTIPNQAVKKLWDPSKSATVNMAQMGLTATPNCGFGAEKISRTATGSHALITAATTGTGTTCEKANVIELFDIPESDKPSRRTRFPLEKEEEIYIARCMEKWGVDYKRMFRDTKRGVGVNEYQYTEEVLHKMGSRFLLLSPEQRRVPVPDKVKDELPIHNTINKTTFSTTEDS